MAVVVATMFSQTMFLFCDFSCIDVVTNSFYLLAISFQFHSMSHGCAPVSLSFFRNFFFKFCRLSEFDWFDSTNWKNCHLNTSTVITFTHLHTEIHCLWNYETTNFWMKLTIPFLFLFFRSLSRHLFEFDSMYSAPHRKDTIFTGCFAMEFQQFWGFLIFFFECFFLTKRKEWFLRLSFSCVDESKIDWL